MGKSTRVTRLNPLVMCRIPGDWAEVTEDVSAALLCVDVCVNM